MSQLNKSDAKTNGVAKHKAEGIGPHPRWRQKTAMDVWITIFTTLTIIGGAVLGFLGVSGSLKNRQSLGLWILYVTIVFALTWAFLYFQKWIWQEQAAVAVRTTPKDRPAADTSASTKDLPFVHVPVLSFVDLDEGKTPYIRAVIRNGGGSPARCVIGADNWRLTQSTTAYDGPFKPSSGPSYSGLLGIGDDAVGITTINPPLNNSQIRDIKQRDQFFYYYLDIEHDDVMGNHYLTRTCNVYNPLTKHFDVCDVHNDNQQLKERKYPCPKAN